MKQHPLTCCARSQRVSTAPTVAGKVTASAVASRRSLTRHCWVAVNLAVTIILYRGFHSTADGSEGAKARSPHSRNPRPRAQATATLVSLASLDVNGTAALTPWPTSLNGNSAERCAGSNGCETRCQSLGFIEKSAAFARCARFSRARFVRQLAHLDVIPSTCASGLRPCCQATAGMDSRLSIAPKHWNPTAAARGGVALAFSAPLTPLASSATLNRAQHVTQEARR